MTLIDRFSKKYFNSLGAHERAMNVLVSDLSKQFYEQNTPYIDEGHIRSEFKRILEHKINKIDPNLIVLVNENNWNYNKLLENRINKKLNTELDLQVTDRKGNLIAAYELKSLCNRILGSASKVYRDFHRLSLIKIINPKVTTMFLLVGKEDVISSYFLKNSLLIPYKSKKGGIITNKIIDSKSNNRIYRIPISQASNKYQVELGKMGIKFIKFRTSRRPYSLNMHAYSFEVLLPELEEVN